MQNDVQAKQPKAKSKKNPVMILASIGLLGIAYIPAPKPRPDKEFIRKVYIRPTCGQRWQASEMRKKEIMAEIRKIRKEIRLQAESYIDDRTKERVEILSNREKRNAHTYKLMAAIADKKGVLS